MCLFSVSVGPKLCGVYFSVSGHIEYPVVECIHIVNRVIGLGEGSTDKLPYCNKGLLTINFVGNI